MYFFVLFQISFLANRSAKGVRSLGMSMGGTGWTPPRSYFPRASTPSITLEAVSSIKDHQFHMKLTSCKVDSGIKQP